MCVCVYIYICVCVCVCVCVQYVHTEIHHWIINMFCLHSMYLKSNKMHWLKYNTTDHKTQYQVPTLTCCGTKVPFLGSLPTTRFVGPTHTWGIIRPLFTSWNLRLKMLKLPDDSTFVPKHVSVGTWYEVCFVIFFYFIFISTFWWFLKTGNVKKWSLWIHEIYVLCSLHFSLVIDPKKYFPVLWLNLYYIKIWC
jgi:hypothetical protein